MTVFSHILSKEESVYNEELDKHVVDLDVFLGNEGQPSISSVRDISDIIFITDTYSRVQGKHVRNVVPLGPFIGNKKDFTLVSLGRYLKSSYGLMPSGVAPTQPKKGVDNTIK